MGALVLLWMMKSKDTPESQVKQKQSLEAQIVHSGPRTKPADLSDQKLNPEAQKVVDRQAVSTRNQGGTGRGNGEKSRSQEAQESLRYRSLYQVSFVSTPFQTTQAEALGSAPISSPSKQQPSTTDRANNSQPEKRNPLDFDPSLPQSTLTEGTVIEMALDNKLEGEMTGPVECHVTSDVYALGTQTVVIPAGSRVLGQSNKVGNFGQQRLLVTFHRMLVNDSLGAPLYSIPLTPQESGMDQEGGMGVTGKVNNHIASTILSSLAVGLLGAGSSGFGYSQNGGAIVLSGIGQSTSQAATRIFDRYSNRMPTISVVPGARVKLLLVDDLKAPIYDSRN